jgi:Flp pilus assembly protein TadD
LFARLRSVADLDIEVLWRYLERRYQWEAGLHSPGLLDGGGDGRLPSALRAVCHMREALICWQSRRDHAGALRAVKTAMELDGIFKDPAKNLAAKITVEYEREEEARRRSDESGREEFARLLQSIKPQIERLIALGRSEEALQTITQLETLAPADADIAKLKEIAVAARR